MALRYMRDSRLVCTILSANQLCGSLTREHAVGVVDGPCPNRTRPGGMVTDVTISTLMPLDVVAVEL
jgi:hypothetical protein